ncbi:DNA cytosine methyltransferase [Streptomyces sp. 8L]|uniref:DNA cytosine methyltransferase n=1 Tax=Streptomyces sp. 8L TaxID=2877242 RepID=UPI001CD6495B|nr:DNA (cytosine-5-)-methyltransferase [Streptomyces sp. 8L]MCA1219919.1 DNA cytosine methyltransferase [Streptomyces sp. 8L]
MGSSERVLSSIEICAGAGGQAAGLHQAGFRHLALVEIDKHACATLRENIKERSKEWGDPREIVVEMDVKDYWDSPQLKALGLDAESNSESLDLLAGGVPCPPFSHAGKQLGENDERDLFPVMLRLVDKLRPKAVMIENVRGIMDPKFDDYRRLIETTLGGRLDEAAPDSLGYKVCGWEVLEASKFRVPQLRPRAILVAIRRDILGDLEFRWPEPTSPSPVSVAEALDESMADRYGKFEGEEYAEALKRWRGKAKAQAEKDGGNGGIAPTLVGGSKKHGGADLGPSRAKAAWEQLGVSGLGVANQHEVCVAKRSQERDLLGAAGPMLTVKQAAIIQGFSPEWKFSGGKTAQYRQVGNAFPPPVAKAVGKQILQLLLAAKEKAESAKAAQLKLVDHLVESAPAVADRADYLESASV